MSRRHNQGFAHAHGRVRRLNYGGTPTPSPTPTPSFTTWVAEGDSITAGVNPGDNNGSYAFSTSAPSGKTLTVRAQGSRYTGKITDLDTLNNTLMGHVTEDVTTYGGQLVTAMIGTNDMSGASTAATLRSDLALYWSKIKAAGGKFAVSPPPSMNSLQQYAGYATFMARRADYLATVRDPSVWGLFADYYFPLGEQPELNATDNSTYISTDGVHPTGPASTAGTGQAKLLTVYQPFVNSVLDETRISSTSPYSSVWPASETSLAISSTITRRFIVSGIAHGGLATGVSVTGDGSPQVSLNGGTFASSVGTGSSNGYRIYNGDTVDLELTTSALNSTVSAVALTIGSETRTINYTTVVAAADVTFTLGGNATSSASATSQTYSGLSFASGCPVVVLNDHTNAGGSTSSSPTSIKLKLNGTGPDILLAQRYNQGRSTNIGRNLELWSGTADIAAGTYSVIVTRPSAAANNVIIYGVLVGADPTPVAATGNTPAETSNTNHSTPSATVPSHGLSLAAIYWEVTTSDTTDATVTSPATFIDEAEVDQTTSRYAITLAQRATTGTIEFTKKTGTFARLIVTWKALGT